MRNCARPHRRLIREVHGERAADDGLYAGRRHLFREFQRAEQVSRVGQGNRRLPVFARELGELRNRKRALKQRIGRMDVKMDELCLRHGGLNDFLESYCPD